MTAQRNDPRQLGLFGNVLPEEPKPASRKAQTPKVEPAAVSPEVAELAAQLPVDIRLGTSSWAFPGWRGLVYAPNAPESQLARHGLAAYAQHPLFRTVGIDRTYYRPISEADFARYAAAVPAQFRFLCKAHEWLTAPTQSRFSERPKAGRKERGDASRAQDQPDGGESAEPENRTGATTTPGAHFLDAAYATDVVIGPMVAGLGEKAGPLVFQFVPLGKRTIGSPEKFIDRLYRFLAALPRGPLYVVEIRNRELLIPAYRDALKATGACHCFNVHPAMPLLTEQAEIIPPDTGRALVARWMLNRRWDYEGAQAAYAPFDRLIDEDLTSRNEIAELCAAAARRGMPAFVCANNKAEGSSPLTLIRLAERIAERLRPRSA